MNTNEQKIYITLEEYEDLKAVDRAYDDVALERDMLLDAFKKMFAETHGYSIGKTLTCIENQLNADARESREYLACEILKTGAVDSFQRAMDIVLDILDKAEEERKEDARTAD